MKHTESYMYSKILVELGGVLEDAYFGTESSSTFVICIFNSKIIFPNLSTQIWKYPFTLFPNFVNSLLCPYLSLINIFQYKIHQMCEFPKFLIEKKIWQKFRVKLQTARKHRGFYGRGADCFMICEILVLLVFRPTIFLSSMIFTI